MALQAIYQHHERTTTADLEADLQLREIGIDPVQKFLTAYSEVLGTKLRGITQESPSVSLAGTLAVAGNATFAGTAAISGNTTIVGNLGVIGGTLLVTGDVTIGDALKRVDVGELLITNTASGDIRLYPSSGDIILTAGGGQSSISVLDNTDAVAIVGATSITGNTGITGTLGASGNFAINTNKFNVTASSGNFSNAGTASIGDSLTVVGTAAIGGNFAIATTKFLVNASTGAVTSVTSDFTIKDDFGLSLTLSQASTNDTPPRLNFRKARGTHASLSNASNGDYTFDIVGYANSNGYQAGAAIKAVVDGTFTTGDRPPSRMEFYTNIANGAQTKQLSIDGSGAVVLTGSLEVGDSLSVQGVTTLYNIVQYDSASDFFLMNINTGDVALSTNAGDVRLEPTGDIFLRPSSGRIEADNISFLKMSSTGKSQILLNSLGSDYGTIQNTASNEWALGHKSTDSSVLGTSILKWNASGLVTIPGDLTLSSIATGRIPYTTTAGLLTSGTGLTYNGSAFSVTGTGAFSGDFAIATNKFNVTAATGNFSNAGTASIGSNLSAVGDFAINTNKFNITAATGNASSAGNYALAGRLNIGGATDAPNFGVNVLNSYIAATGTYSLLAYGFGVPGAADNEHIGLSHIGTAGRILVDRNGTGSYRPLIIQTGGSTAITVGIDQAVTIADELIVNGVTTLYNIIQYDSASDFFLMNVNTGDVALSTNAGNIRLEPTGGITLVQGNLAIQSPSVPASASSTGTEGEIAWSSTHLYVCIATDTWKRVAIATW